MPRFAFLWSPGTGTGIVFLVSALAAMPAVNAQQSDDPALVEAALEGSQQRIVELVAELGSREFAARERSADQLTQMGTTVIPQLRSVIESTDDPEVRLRASEIVRQLTDGDLQAQIDGFLAGKEIEFEGWQRFRRSFGDTPALRDLFIELMKQHPLLTKSLDGETRDRAVALESVISGVRNATTIERRFPNRADVFALLLAGVDPNLPPNPALEAQVMMVMNQSAVREIRRNSQLKRPFESLLGIWMAESAIGNRQEIIEIGMRMDAESTLDLALRTLGESNDEAILTTALQAIARFGKAEHASTIRRLIEDARAIPRQGLPQRPGFTSQVGDVAMVTTAIILKGNLESIGFRDVTVHPNIGFDLQNVGFDSPEKRKIAKEKVSSLFAPGILP
ncbi:MAG: hypothetical protein GY904_19200 [Planctomycetaceae bacterium]|nr:hypothetical protein [Planctomycetaceae bacterium]